jgi:hypothetical protein
MSTGVTSQDLHNTKIIFNRGGMHTSKNRISNTESSPISCGFLNGIEFEGMSPGLKPNMIPNGNLLKYHTRKH